MLFLHYTNSKAYNYLNNTKSYLIYFDAKLIFSKGIESGLQTII